MEEEYELKVEDTNEEALASKVSAVRKGYFSDPFAEEFVKFKGKRDVIMHRGYWARLYLFKHILDHFLSEGNDARYSAKNIPLQVISFGSGLDTSYFNERHNEKEKLDYTYTELDLPVVCHKKVNDCLMKIKKIMKSEKIKDLLKQRGQILVSEDGNTLRAGPYTITPCDLSQTEDFLKVLEKFQIDLKKPTLFFCQCVISYIDPHKFDKVLKLICDKFDICFFLDYEMFNPKSRFGQMMVKNFASRGCPLIGIDAYPMLQDQKKRFLDAGFKEVEIHSMIKIYNELLDKAEKARIEKLEYLDEFQEWNIIMGHYFGMVAGHYSEGAKNNPVYQKLRETVRIRI